MTINSAMALSVMELPTSSVRIAARSSTLTRSFVALRTRDAINAAMPMAGRVGALDNATPLVRMGAAFTLSHAWPIEPGRYDTRSPAIRMTAKQTTTTVSAKTASGPTTEGA
ncbi:hypothetical protein GCM10009537_17440 [Corynebacterium riegelii]